MRNLLPLIFALLILSGCDSSNTRTKSRAPIIIYELKLSEFTSSKSEFSKAINKIKEHLTRLNVPIDSMYYIGVDSSHGEQWEFRLEHYDHFLEREKINTARKIEDSLERSGVKNHSFYPPPTGNWGGHDRTLIYSTNTNEIITDLIDQ